MSSLNPITPITPNLEDVRPQRWSIKSPRVSGIDVSSQGYPPNVSASIVTVNLPSRVQLTNPPDLLIAIEGTDILNNVFEGADVLNKSVFEAIDFRSGNFSLFNLQEPAVRKETKIKTFMSPVGDAIVHDIDELMAGKEDEVKPTAYAYAYARRVVLSAYGKAKIVGTLPTIVPKPLATTDDVGGIRLLWHLGAKNVRLNFGAEHDRQSYLYYEAGQDHGVEPLDEDHLVEKLAWLAAR
jgi:hypothetical protein